MTEQGFAQTPYTQFSIGTRSRLYLAPSNPPSMPGSPGGRPSGSDSAFLTAGLFEGAFPPIPRPEIGYLNNFGNRVRAGNLNLYYMLPVALSENPVLFGEAPSERHEFRKTLKGMIDCTWSTPNDLLSPDTRTDISLGGGYRRIFNDSTLIGFNGFFDTAWLGSQWHSSGGVGCEPAMSLSGNDAPDLNFNW